MDAAKKKGLHYGICLILSLFLLFLVAGARPVKAYQTTIDTNGKTFYLFDDYLSSQDVNNCRLYMKTNYGSQLVASMNYDRNAGMTYSMSYGKNYISVLRIRDFITILTHTRLDREDSKKRGMVLNLQIGGENTQLPIHMKQQMWDLTDIVYIIFLQKNINIWDTVME